ncbi:MAG: DUF3108 domain-containing protein [Deltaproteobacteria bacterium]|nr:DUF3108 domain-containing protein [Deltaproteobacteria bacterium]
MSGRGVGAAWWAAAMCVVLLGTGAAFAGDPIAVPQIADSESGTQRIEFIGSGELLYNMSWTMTRADEGGRKSWRYHLDGDNGKTGAARITWVEDAVYDLLPEGLRTRWWKKVSSGAEQETWELRFDWAAKSAAYKYEDRASGKTENTTVKFGDNTYPLDAMNFLLRGLPFEKGPGTSLTGSFVMTDGTLLSGSMVLIGEEKVETPIGTFNAYKVQLKPKGLVGAVAPDMFMWFAKAAPHAWLRYDGRDDGLTSPRTRNVLTKYEPRATLGGK